METPEIERVHFSILSEWDRLTMSHSTTEINRYSDYRTRPSTVPHSTVHGREKTSEVPKITRHFTVRLKRNQVREIIKYNNLKIKNKLTSSPRERHDEQVLFEGPAIYFLLSYHMPSHSIFRIHWNCNSSGWNSFTANAWMSNIPGSFPSAYLRAVQSPRRCSNLPSLYQPYSRIADSTRRHETSYNHDH